MNNHKFIMKLEVSVKRRTTQTPSQAENHSALANPSPQQRWRCEDLPQAAWNWDVVKLKSMQGKFDLGCCGFSVLTGKLV